MKVLLKNQGKRVAHHADLGALREYHIARKHEIKSRLEDFSRFRYGSYAWAYENGKLFLGASKKNLDERLFEELSFCILTANSSFTVGMKAINSIRNLLAEADAGNLQKKLKAIRCRFHTKRAHYIASTRDYLENEHNFRLSRLINSLSSDRNALRDFFASNPGIKGIGYKEASHFLRNIGFSGYAILDKHVLSAMQEFGITMEMKRPSNRAQYISLEGKLADFSRKVGIDFDELDLLLWSRKTGEVLK